MKDFELIEKTTVDDYLKSNPGIYIHMIEWNLNHYSGSEREKYLLTKDSFKENILYHTNATKTSSLLYFDKGYVYIMYSYQGITRDQEFHDYYEQFGIEETVRLLQL